MVAQTALFILLIGVIVMFVWGRYRYDVVAIGALVIAVLIGVVPAKEAFSGFASSAVVTVAAVLIISRGLTNSGAIERIAKYLLPEVKSVTLQMGSLNVFTGGLSAVMNNVGALALLMPATINAARALKKPVSLFLMPLSFASILGGMVTLIGTPPNIIIASLREEYLGAPYTMFDFSPVGGAVALGGIIFLTLVAWRFLPKERHGKGSADLFQIEAYTAEVKTPKDSKLIGTPVQDLDEAAHDYGIHIAGVIRKKRRILSIRPTLLLESQDILILEAEPADLDKFAHEQGFEIVGDIAREKSLFTSEDVDLAEVVVSSDSRLTGRRVSDLRLKSRYRLNLLGISRQGVTLRKSLKKVVIQTGDVLLLQADRDTLSTVLARLGLLPLAGRGVSIGKRHQAVLAVAFLGLAVGLASLGLVDLTIALTTAALGMVLLNIVPVQEIYESVDWPVIVLVGAMIPIGGALQTVGATALLAEGILALSGDLPIPLIMALVMFATMTLSDIMNNVATAVVMAPVALAIAAGLGVNPDAFLMTVAVGASCAFLTPIGHKNNALILGPGGYKFGDYWRMGLPLEALILLIGVPMILVVWPL